MLFPSNFHKVATNCDVCGLHRRGSHFKIVQAFTFWNTVLRTGQLRKIRKTLKMLTTKMSTKSLVIHGPRVERLKIRIRVNKIRSSVCVCARTWARRRRDTDNVCCTAASALTTVRCCDFIREKSDGRKKKSSVCCSRTSADTCHCREGEKKHQRIWTLLHLRAWRHCQPENVLTPDGRAFRSVYSEIQCEHVSRK